MFSTTVHTYIQITFKKCISQELDLIAQFKVLNNLQLSSDQVCISLFMFLDLRAAFTTGQHTIVLYRLENVVCSMRTALSWLRSHLTDWYLFVGGNGNCFMDTKVKFGDLQGSMWQLSNACRHNDACVTVLLKPHPLSKLNG